MHKDMSSHGARSVSDSAIDVMTRIDRQSKNKPARRHRGLKSEKLEARRSINRPALSSTSIPRHPIALLIPMTLRDTQMPLQRVLPSKHHPAPANHRPPRLLPKPHIADAILMRRLRDGHAATDPVFARLGVVRVDVAVQVRPAAVPLDVRAARDRAAEVDGLRACEVGGHLDAARPGVPW